MDRALSQSQAWPGQVPGFFCLPLLGPRHVLGGYLARAGQVPANRSTEASGGPKAFWDSSPASGHQLTPTGARRAVLVEPGPTHRPVHRVSVEATEL